MLYASFEVKNETEITVKLLRRNNASKLQHIMQSYWLNKEGNEDIVIFVLGWATDHRLVEHIGLPGYDVLCLYDYSAADFDGKISPDYFTAEQYRRRYLFAWSFGVLVADKLLGEYEFTRAVALNGTPAPVSDLYGIEPRRLAITIRGLANGGMEAFNKKAYGDLYEELSLVLSPRPLGRNIEELTVLQKVSLEAYMPCLQWSRAIIGSSDVRFSPVNMERYWSSQAKIPVEILPSPHYPFAHGRIGTDEREQEK